MELNWVPPFIFNLLGIVMLAMTFKKSLFKKNNRSQTEDWQKLLISEHNAQFVRNKALPADLFLCIDFDAFPSVENVDCQKVYSSLLYFKGLQMMNLKNHTNLELKMAFGPQVIETISHCERNYFEFMDILYRYGKILYENHYIEEAKLTLEQSMSYHCELSKIYLLLIEIYQIEGNQSALNQLKTLVQNEMQDSPFLNKILERF